MLRSSLPNTSFDATFVVNALNPALLALTNCGDHKNDAGKVRGHNDMFGVSTVQGFDNGRIRKISINKF
jgi:hypothetical protein